MENIDKEAEFERCIDLLSSMIELYGAEVLQEIEDLGSSHIDNECVA